MPLCGGREQIVALLNNGHYVSPEESFFAVDIYARTNPAQQNPRRLLFMTVAAECRQTRLSHFARWK